MKRLYIIRHAQAEALTNKQLDFQRNLTQHGLKQAQLSAVKLIESLTEQPLQNCSIVSSTANRAAQTTALFCKALKLAETDVRYTSTIYEAHYLELLKVINDTRENYAELILFGHNPGLSNLVNYLCADYVNLDTANIACLILEDGTGFSTVSANTAKLKQILGP